MKVLSAGDIQSEQVRRLMTAISFLRDMEENFASERHTVMETCFMWRYDKDEYITSAGDSAGSIFLIISGWLVVESETGDELGQIGAGEWLGDLSIFNLSNRSANVRVSSQSALLLMIPKNLLAPGDSIFSDALKIYFYRNISQGIRWKLDQALARAPDHSLKSELRELRLIAFQSESTEEWRDYINRLATPLREWNQRHGTHV